MSKYNDSLTSAFNVYKSSLESSVSLAQTSFASITDKVAEYISEHPINAYVDGTVFREAITTYGTDLRSLINSYIARANYSDSVRRGNAEIDFNDAINNANTAFYDKLNSVIITDVDYQTKYDDIKTQMETFTADIITQLQTVSTDHTSALFDQVNAIRDLCYSQVLDFVKDRPILRIIDFRYPIEVGLSYDYSPEVKYQPATLTTPVVYSKAEQKSVEVKNTIEVDIKNIGKKQWRGWIGIVVTDEYYKKLEFLGQAGFDSSINPGETVTVKRTDIILPAVMMVKGEPRSLGKTLTYKIVVNTIT